MPRLNTSKTEQEENLNLKEKQRNEVREAVPLKQELLLVVRTFRILGQIFNFNFHILPVNVCCCLASMDLKQRTVLALFGPPRLSFSLNMSSSTEDTSDAGRPEVQIQSPRI